MKSIKLLIVDDNLDFCDILKDFFETEQGIEISGIANNGTEGLDLIMQIQPDVVLLDIVMPGIDGIVVLERINKELKKRPIVIILSALGQDKVTSSAIALGADYYVIKPVNLYLLVDRIRFFFSLLKDCTEGGMV